MKCLSCKEGTLELTMYERKKRGSYFTAKTKAILECDKCGHKEVF